MDANGVLAPPVFLYWLALAVRLFGANPWAWKLCLLPFCLFTLVGATLWNGLLLWAGYVWQGNVDKITPYYKVLDIVVVLVGVVVVATWIYLHVKRPPPAPWSECTPIFTWVWHGFRSAAQPKRTYIFGVLSK